MASVGRLRRIYTNSHDMNGINVVPGYGTPPASVRRTIPVHVAPPQATAAAALRRRFDEQDSDSATYVAHSTVPQEVYDQERYFATCDSIQSKVRQPMAHICVVAISLLLQF